MKNETAMTNEQILELAKTCAIFNVGDDCWECFEEDLLKFAKAIYENGYNNGYDDGCFGATGGNG